MTDLLSLFSSIEGALQKLDRRVLLNALRPGVPAYVVRTAITRVGLGAIPELEALYGWRNGANTAGMAAVDDIHLFPGFYLLSLHDAIVNYQALTGHVRWAAGWLPLFANGGGDFYILDVNSPTGSAIRHFRIEESEHPIEFASLTALLTTLAAAFEAGVFFVDSSGYLEMDDLAFGRLAADLNPDIAWWRS